MSELYSEEDFDDNDDVDFEEKVTTRRSSKKDLSDTKVENAGDIPLFADSDKRGLRTATYLKVVKLSAPNQGFKGEMPLTTTLETIGRIHGDGRYKIELCNHKHNVLRSIEETISIGESNNKEIKDSTVDIKDRHIAALITSANQDREKEAERIERLSKATAEQAIQQSKDFTQLVTKTTESAAEREREHMKGVNENQQNFFANILLTQQQMFQQNIAMMSASHQQTMELMRAANEKERELNNPMLFVSLMMEGLKMGRDLAGDEDTPDYIKAIKEGGNMLGQLVELKKEHPYIKNKELPKETKKAVENNENSNKKGQVFTQDEAIAAYKLKKALRSRGIDFKTMVEQASKHYESVPDSELFIDDEEKSNESNESVNEEEKKEEN